ncbi:polysaccharide deacetylase family protein [Herbaspirillum huttiense]|uniref:polysaccharide deacetylase family protein n=1 Tax=Herbaspirillum huttiense TaxID=863372 RepID=UPI003B3AD27F
MINYHRILPTPDALLGPEPDVATFRWQMELLATCFNVLPLGAAVQASADGRLPPRAACITFDDGYRSLHDLALPVLTEFKLPATVFITTGHIDQGNMWNDRIVETVQAMPAGQLDLTDLGLGTYSLHGVAQRRTAIATLTERAKYLPPAARQAVVDRLAVLAGQETGPELMLTREMVLNLERNGIEIGAHTVSHPILTSLDDDAARAEIAGSKAGLEAILGKPVPLFAYPNGKPGMDYDDRHVAMVREAGYDAAFTTEVGAITRNHDRYQLPRSRPWDLTPLGFGLRLVQWLAQGHPR